MQRASCEEVTGASRALLCATTRAALILLLALASPNASFAQEESDDHGSRATRQRANSRKRSIKLDTDYHVGTFLGYYAQDKELGGMLDAEFSENLRMHDHVLGVELNYLYDSFSTKVFNFPEEDQAVSNYRLVQPAHDLGGVVSWSSKWSKRFRSELSVLGGLLFPQYYRDQRRDVELRLVTRIGKRRGLYLETKGQLFAKKYPHYLVADRRLDQREAEATAEVGYDLRHLGVVALGFEFRYSDYLDARYQQLLPDGTVVRAKASKNYLRYSPYVELTYRPSRLLRTKVKYYVQFHDSQHYDRTMTGRNARGALEEKLIFDYYDYTRHGLFLSFTVKPLDGLSVHGMAELWVRSFNAYEARSADNWWLGETRLDKNIEVGLEVSYLVATLLAHDVSLVAFASQLSRNSNMRREVSLATNFDITRVFAGVEVALD